MEFSRCGNLLLTAGIHPPRNSKYALLPFQQDPPISYCRAIRKILAAPMVGTEPASIKIITSLQHMWQLNFKYWTIIRQCIKFEFVENCRNLTWKFKSPKKFILTKGFRRDHTYTNIIVNACPRNNRLTKNAKVYS